MRKRSSSAAEKLRAMVLFDVGGQSKLFSTSRSLTPGEKGALKGASLRLRTSRVGRPFLVELFVANDALRFLHLGWALRACVCEYVREKG